MKNIYLIDIETDSDILSKLIVRVPKEYRTLISKKAKQYIIKEATFGDSALIFNYTPNYRNAISQMYLQGCNVIPSYDLSELCRDRIKCTKFIEDLSRCYIEREYYHSGRNEFVKFEPGWVYKLGNCHQGINKYIHTDIGKNLWNEDYIKERFIEGRSFRVLLIGSSVFVIEHTNSNTWIKNINPDEEIIYTDPLNQLSNDFNVSKMIDDAKYIKRHCARNGLVSPTFGFDYVANNKDVCLLEMNDMCGLPNNKDIIDAYVEESCKLLEI